MGEAMKSKILSMLLALVLVFSCSIKVYGYELTEQPDCRAAIIMEQGSGSVLYEYNSNERLPMASVTKLMTYYVFMEYAREEGMDFEQTVRVSTAGWNLTSAASSIGLKDGESLTISQLIQGTLIVSANDFATALRDVYETNGGSMVSEMNRKAQEMGLASTSFINVTGLTANDGSDTNYSSARDIAILCKAIIDEFPETLNITSRKSFDYNGKTFATTNKLLEEDSGVDGMKTGYTEAAGYCLASTKILQPSQDNYGQHRVITVVLGCKSEVGRVQESEKLLKYAGEGFANERVASATDAFTSQNPFYKAGTIAASTNQDTYVLHNIDDTLQVKAVFNSKLTKKITKGDKIGTLVITNADGTENKVPLYAADDYKTVNIFKKLILHVKNFFTNLF
jgi:D-alanyl-D-alanine carboxypeptidase (penicillin-binding protein 5/6)